MKRDSVAITDLLNHAPVREHIVNFYDDSMGLAKRVSDFAEAGLKGREAVILIAIPPHLSLFRRVLQNRQLPVVSLEKSGRLVCLPVQATLEEFSLNGKIYWPRFEIALGSKINRLSKMHGKVRIYGDMVNVLWQQGLVANALELEGFWNQLSALHPFCLFCAYSLAIFEPAHFPQALAAICHTHSHSFVDVADRSFEGTVDRVMSRPRTSASDLKAPSF